MSVARLPLETIGAYMISAATWNHMDVQGLCGTGPALPSSGKLAPLPTGEKEEAGHTLLLGSRMELALVKGA